MLARHPALDVNDDDDDDDDDDCLDNGICNGDGEDDYANDDRQNIVNDAGKPARP